MVQSAHGKAPGRTLLRLKFALRFLKNCSALLFCLVLIDDVICLEGKLPEFHHDHWKSLVLRNLLNLVVRLEYHRLWHGNHLYFFDFGLFFLRWDRLRLYFGRQIVLFVGNCLLLVVWVVKSEGFLLRVKTQAVALIFDTKHFAEIIVI